MTKIKQSDFAMEAATPIAKPKTRAQRLAAWRKENKEAYKKACDSHCMCSPSRAELLLMEQYDGNGPADL